jgi:hypothetical protein
MKLVIHGINSPEIEVLGLVARLLSNGRDVSHHGYHAGSNGRRRGLDLFGLGWFIAHGFCVFSGGLILAVGGLHPFSGIFFFFVED